MRAERRRRVIQVRSVVNHRRMGGAGERTEGLCYFQVGCSGGLSEGQGQSGGRWCRRGVDRAVREGPEREPLQAVESDVLGLVFPAAGSGGGDTEEGWRGENARGAHRGGPGGPDRGAHVSGAGGGTDLPSRLLRLSAWALGVGCGGHVPATVL